LLDSLLQESTMDESVWSLSQTSPSDIIQVISKVADQTLLHTSATASGHGLPPSRESVIISARPTNERTELSPDFATVSEMLSSPSMAISPGSFPEEGRLIGSSLKEGRWTETSPRQFTGTGASPEERWTGSRLRQVTDLGTGIMRGSKEGQWTGTSHQLIETSPIDVTNSNTGTGTSLEESKWATLTGSSPQERQWAGTSPQERQWAGTSPQERQLVGTRPQEKQWIGSSPRQVPGTRTSVPPHEEERGISILDYTAEATTSTAITSKTSRQRKNTRSSSEGSTGSPGPSQRVPVKWVPRPLVTLCAVCSGPATDVQHYGSISCYSCRAFFRRSVGSKKEYGRCSRGTDNCVIDPVNRTNCKLCRFNKCIEVGMLPEKVDKVARKRNALKKQQEEEESDTALVQHDHSLKMGRRGLDLESLVDECLSEQIPPTIDMPELTFEEEFTIYELLARKEDMIATSFNLIRKKPFFHQYFRKFLESMNSETGPQLPVPGKWKLISPDDLIEMRNEVSSHFRMDG